jgi:hypothetical protein
LSTRKKITVVLCIALSICYSTYHFFSKENHRAEESLIFFPIDPTVQFTEALTNISLYDQKDNDEYTVKWLAQSRLDRKAYLRQDISLLYEDGKLIGTFSRWKENSKNIKQSKKVKGEDSSYYEAISFHHAEIHYPDDVIKSRQLMSSDHLYVIDSPLSPLESFKVPETELQKEWREILNNTRYQQLYYVWNSLIEEYQIKSNNYFLLPLTSLVKFNNKPLPNLSLAKSEKAIGGLWEGIYKNYFLGIKNSGSITSPIGSSLPLILLDKKGTHFIILFESHDGKKVQLLQQIN